MGNVAPRVKMLCNFSSLFACETLHDMATRDEWVAILSEHLSPKGLGKQARLAKALGYKGTSTISRWKRGKPPRDPAMRAKVADYFGDERLRDVEEQPAATQLDRIEAGVERLIELLRREGDDDPQVSQLAGDELARVEAREPRARREREAS